MEKSGLPIFTKEDLEDFQEGFVSQRILENWSLTFSELKVIIDSQQYISSEKK